MVVRDYEVSIEFLGASNTVTGSKHLIRYLKRTEEPVYETIQPQVNNGSSSSNNNGSSSNSSSSGSENKKTGKNKKDNNNTVDSGDVSKKSNNGQKKSNGNDINYEDQFLVMIDCGMFQGVKELRLRNWEPISLDENIEKNTDYIIVTHCHIDHIGYLPRMVSQGFSGKIFATPDTFEVMQITLLDAAHLQEEDAKYANKKNFSKHNPALPLFTIDDVEKVFDLVEVVQYKTIKKLEKNGMKLQFQYHDAGHILGSAFIEVWLDPEVRKKKTLSANDSAISSSSSSSSSSIIEEVVVPRKILFSGDLGSFKHNIPLQSVPDIPVKDCADYLVVESTYGNRIHMEPDDRDNLEDLLKPQLKDAVSYIVKKKGILLIPAFAIGRSQHLAYIILKMMKDGEIPTLPVHMNSPMAAKALQLYKTYAKSAGEHDALAILKKVIVHESTEDSINFQKKVGEALTKKTPLIIISSSGMMAGGRVLHHAVDILPSPDNMVLLSGFQAAGTRGRDLLTGKKELKMHGQTIQVRAQIYQLRGVSGHGDCLDIVDRWMKNILSGKRMKQVFIVHGEPKASRDLSIQIMHRAPHVSCVVPNQRSIFMVPHETYGSDVYYSTELIPVESGLSLQSAMATATTTTTPHDTLPIEMSEEAISPTDARKPKHSFRKDYSDNGKVVHEKEVIIEREPRILGVHMSAFVILVLSSLVIGLSLRKK